MVDQWQDVGGVSEMLKMFMSEDSGAVGLCVWNSSRVPLLVCQNLVVLSWLVLIVGQEIGRTEWKKLKELVVELPRFSNELSLWDCQHQSVHFLLKLSVLVEHECCYAEHHSNRDSNCDCD